jgi:uncharacterized protein (TIGR02147 family)
MEASIFDYLDYREFIQKRCKNVGVSYRSLAMAALMHGSYFSRVMKGGAIFSQSQLYLIGKNLKLNSEEIDFLLLMGEMNNSGNQEHQNFLRTKLTKIQKQKSRLLNKFKEQSQELSQNEIDLYYREAITAIVHMLLTLKKYRDSPASIIKRTFITEVKLESELRKLESLNLIERDEDGDITVLKSNVHLDESDPASVQNHINWRLQTINHLNMRGNDPNDYHLSASFSCNEKTKAKIKKIFKDFVVEAQHAVRSSKGGTQELYHINMDLF